MKKKKKCEGCGEFMWCSEAEKRRSERDRKRLKKAILWALGMKLKKKPSGDDLCKCGGVRAQHQCGADCHHCGGQCSSFKLAAWNRRTKQDAMEMAKALKNKIDAFITCDGEWDTDWQAEAVITAALLAARKEGMEKIIGNLPRCSKCGYKDNGRAIRRLEE